MDRPTTFQSHSFIGFVFNIRECCFYSEPTYKKWPCFSGNLLKVTRPVYATVHVYTGQCIKETRPFFPGHPVHYKL